MTRPGRSRDGGINGGRAAILIAVLVVLAIGVLARSGGHPAVTTSASTHHPASTTTTTVHSTPTSTTPTTVLPASQVKVQVLNGVLTGSLAGQWSTKLKTSDGYVTEPADNATSKVSASVIYVLTPGYQSEAQALAATVGLPSSAVNTTVPPPSNAPIPTAERATANLVLVVGPDLAGTA